MKVADSLGSGLLTIATTRPNNLPNSFAFEMETVPSGESLTHKCGGFNPSLPSLALNLTLPGL